MKYVKLLLVRHDGAKKDTIPLFPSIQIALKVTVALEK